MARLINASVITELAKDGFVMVDLATFTFDNDSPANIVRLTSAPFTVNDGTNDFFSSGNLMATSNITESADLRVGTMTFTFSAADQTWVSLFLNNNYTDEKVEYWRALLDSNHAVIGAPLLMFEGRVSGASITDQGRKSEIRVECASHWANFEAINGRKTNDNSQQAIFSGDLGMEFAHQAIDNIRWGGK